jgi:very-short-patch-repair endonuclease
LALGFDSRSVEHRLRTGRLHRVMQGVYLVGWPQATRKQRWMAAVLACGEGAALSHRSAAALWGIGREGRLIDVSVAREKRRPDIHSRIRPGLPPPETTVRHGIRVTTPIQTLIDLALELAGNQLERAVNEADKRDLIDPEKLREELDSHAGEPGVKALRTLLDKATFRLSDTELEVLLRPIAAAAGVPVELTKHVVNDFEVDFYWPSLGLVVETDGLRYHRTPAAQARDAVRDQTHTAAGLTRLRFTHWQVKYEPAHVRGILAATRRHLRARA